jgi:UPF0716 protein FxsA
MLISVGISSSGFDKGLPAQAYAARLSTRFVTVFGMRFLAIFALTALAEMATFFWVESRIGLGWALLLALGTAVVGSLLVRRAGLSIIGRIQAKLREAHLPGRELTHGAAILVAGAFLISPGFITDTLGFLLLLAPIRDAIHRVVSKRLTGRVSVVTTNFEAPREPIHGEVIDVDPEDF